MKAVILAGGFGTRISEESQFKPKPMIEIGGMPILWHIMKELSVYGVNDFVVCAGYKQSVIKEWFANYFLHTSDVTFDFSRGGEMQVHTKHAEAWKVTIVDTGLTTMTGGRIKRVRDYVGDAPFLMTYGDAVGDIDIDRLVAFHKGHGKLATVSVYNFEQNKGVVEIGDDGKVAAFREKSNLDGELINIGYMILDPQVMDFIDGDESIFEQQTLQRIIAADQLVAYKHTGFWQCMDTLREKQKLEKYWASGNAPWRLWK